MAVFHSSSDHLSCEDFAAFVFLSLQWYWDFQRTDSKSCGCPCQGDRTACRWNWNVWQKQSQSASVSPGKVKGSSRWEIRHSCWVRLHLKSSPLRRWVYKTVFHVYFCPQYPSCASCSQIWYYFVHFTWHSCIWHKMGFFCCWFLFFTVQNKLVPSMKSKV